jgi:hypothetical protein
MKQAAKRKGLAQRREALPDLTATPPMTLPCVERTRKMRRHTWTLQNSRSSEQLESVSWIDVSTGWAVGFDRTILCTGDGGLTWTHQQSGTISNLRDVVILPA